MLLNAQAGGRFRAGRKRNFKGAFLGFHLHFEAGPECILYPLGRGFWVGVFEKREIAIKRHPLFAVSSGVSLLLITGAETYHIF